MTVAASSENSGRDSKVPALSERMYHAVAETFRALSDPTRTRIVHLLSGGESTVNGLAGHLDVTPSAVSHQLRVLRQMGLVRFRRQGKETFYTLDDPHIEMLFKEAVRHVGDFVDIHNEERP
jgi:DNA-binding transcriptional ArsR family regulator